MSLRARFAEKYSSLATLIRINTSMSRGAATSSCRILSATNPLSWEFSAFSQNREDGIIDFLCRAIRTPNRYFIEIGAGNGLENNSTWLALAMRYSGLMVEGSAASSEHCAKFVQPHCLGVKPVNMFVEPGNVPALAELALYENPDFLSLDIDGIDFFVMKALFAAGLRPKVVAVEFNSAYGPERSQTIGYKPAFNYLAAHGSGLYYGVSIRGWRSFFEAAGYRFVTVDGNGVNAFFIDPTAFDAALVGGLQGLEFQENFYQMQKFRNSWRQQFSLIEGLEFHAIA